MAYRGPIEALYHAMAAAYFSSGPQKPGYVIQHLPKEVREQLEKLTSDDAKNMRFLK